jgi:hypothetical protein
LRNLDQHPCAWGDNPRRWTRRDGLSRAVITLVGLLVLGVIGMLVLHP